MQKNPTLDQAVRGYVQTHQGSFHPISTSEAVQAIRALVPNAEHTDAEIADLVAAAAVRISATVHFDRPSNRETDT